MEINHFLIIYKKQNMSTATAISTRREKRPQQVKLSKQQEFISWEDFKKHYLTREDGFKYEWLNGRVEQTPYTMEKSQILIQRNLLAIFRNLLHQKKVTGELIAEGDLFFDGHHRRPDLCWLTEQQINNLYDDKIEVPAFVIEIISSNDVMIKVEDKMDDYRAAKVQVVWHIFPKQQKVHVYTGKKLEKMKVRVGKETCSAAPALGEFKTVVEKLFEKI